MNEFRKILFNIRIGLKFLVLSLDLISIQIDNDPDYSFNIFQLGFKNIYERSLLSFRLDKGYSVTCYIDILFFRIYFKDWTGHYKQTTIINRLINKLKK